MAISIQTIAVILVITIVDPISIITVVFWRLPFLHSSLVSFAVCNVPPSIIHAIQQVHPLINYTPALLLSLLYSLSSFFCFFFCCFFCQLSSLSLLS